MCLILYFQLIGVPILFLGISIFIGINICLMGSILFEWIPFCYYCLVPICYQVMLHAYLLTQSGSTHLARPLMELWHPPQIARAQEKCEIKDPKAGILRRIATHKKISQQMFLSLSISIYTYIYTHTYIYYVYTHTIPIYLHT